MKSDATQPCGMSPRNCGARGVAPHDLGPLVPSAGRRRSSASRIVRACALGLPEPHEARRRRATRTACRSSRGAGRRRGARERRPVRRRSLRTRARAGRRAPPPGRARSSSTSGRNRRGRRRRAARRCGAASSSARRRRRGRRGTRRAGGDERAAAAASPATRGEDAGVVQPASAQKSSQ